MFVLDTNVLSELMRLRPEPSVVQWASGKPATALFTTTITEAEILYGVALLPPGARRSALSMAAREMFSEDFADRILPFDRSAARAFAPIVAHRRGAGRPIAHADAQIAAIASSRGASVVTRNVADFADCGVTVIDPWG